MKSVLLSEGTGRTRVNLTTHTIGRDLVVCLFNEQGHLGAVALSDYSSEEDWASTSVLTRLGHKDDALACNATYQLCKHLKKPVCAIAGVHLDDITAEEIAQITHNCRRLVEKLISMLSG